MIALFFSPLYLFSTWLLAFMTNRWLKACSGKKVKTWIKVFIYLIFIVAAMAMPLGFILPGTSEVKYKLLHIGSIWLGVLMYSLFPALIYIVFCIIWRVYKRKKGTTGPLERPRRIAITAATVSILFVIIICTYGIFHATNTQITEYSIGVEKKNGKLDEINAVMVADLHMGLNIGVNEMEKMAALINECEPDIVFICGDIFDNIYDALDDPEKLIEIFKGIKTKYGIYACYGNHDVDEKVLAGFTFNYSEKKVSDPRMDEFLSRAGINLLRDEYVLIDDSFYVYGRPDRSKPGRDIDDRKTPKELMASIPQGYPVIVLDHQPRQQDELAENGCDVDLCGHTHDGQIFPANILVSMLYENSYGYKKFGNMHNIVTSGVGLFGPYMRVGTRSEICNIKISFK